MKRLSAFVVSLCSTFMLFAGDAAVFTDIGFSEDGKTYIFAQYGKLDKSYQAWAEIYTVDVEKNDYVKGGVFKIEASEKTSNLSGKKAFEQLREKTEWQTAKYNCEPSSAQNLLYTRGFNTEAKEEIVFKDFESDDEDSAFYHVKLVPTYEGKGKNVSSKYYIVFEKKDKDGTVLLSKQVGTPNFSRKGISNYTIDRIFTDKTGKSVVFIIEKTLEDDTGKSIRYMVETVRM